jgi:hypothetical protein
MNIFTWLLIGHLVGDWLLQNDWMAQGKRKAFVTLPGFVHFAVYTIVIMIILRFCGNLNETPTYYFGLGILIFVSHWLIDATNLVDVWMRLYKQSNLLMMRIMVDQILHILILAVVVSLVFE